MNINQNINSKIVTLSGYIRVQDRDKSGHVIQIALETDNMEKLIIDNSEKGLSLFNYIDKRVLVIGTVFIQDYIDDELIIVNKFNVIEH